ncbi:hypothetical protein BACCOPRO_01388 [Phocaeicola coprophilus DSM 18228 = JCM 13818]|uniref:Uncharacterized protein n=1 Tax=Phocaeicola coprophilus DSM 18228 = JCM 13818 TaxID=547042 RepID=S0F6J3_9BACT|nr:hypothetical protein BACCOPRO_01388 [Phocaeicola coprophilus DSM 18228 = JCM 13818]
MGCNDRTIRLNRPHNLAATTARFRRNELPASVQADEQFAAKIWQLRKIVLPLQRHNGTSVL